MKKLTSLVISALILLLAVVGCQQQNAPSDNSQGSAAQEQTEQSVRDDVRLSFTQSFVTMDPHNSGNAVDFYAQAQVYEPLIFVRDDGSQEPRLAESYTVSDDGLRYTFTIRQGVKFHSGEEMSVSDVVYSYRRAMESLYLLSRAEAIDSVEAVDDRTFAVNLKYSFAPFITMSSDIYIVSEAFFSDPQNDVNEQACGTGPYQLVLFDRLVELKQTRFDDYWRGPAAIKDISWTIITDANTSVMALESGNLDVLNVPTASWELVRSNEKFTPYVLESPHVYFGIYNLELAPFYSKEVRQALNYAIDKEGMVTMALGGLGTPAYYLARPGYIAYASTAGTQYSLDVEKAKSLLAQGGYPDGVDVGTISTIVGSYDKLAQIWQSNLAAIGVTSSVTVLETSSYLSDISTGNFSIGMMGGIYGSDMHNFSTLYLQSSSDSGNMVRWSNPEVDVLFAEGASENDPQKRQEIYDRVTEIVQEEAIYAPMVHGVSTYAADKNLNFSTCLNKYFVYDWSWK